MEHRTVRETDRPYLPTKTIEIDLARIEKEIFRSFSEVKRRSIRKAIKNNIRIYQSAEIESFIKLKKWQAFPLGFLMEKEIKTLWRSFYPKQATLLLAQCFNDTLPGKEIIAGTLLLFYKQKAYYWLAAANEKGKKSAAPSLLVWEAIKLSKRRGCQIFDFEGIYDERFPKATKSWQGFTKFKMGFGGKIITYPPPFIVAKRDR